MTFDGLQAIFVRLFEPDFVSWKLNMTWSLKRLSLPIQKGLLVLQIIQFAYISISYFTSTFENRFSVLDALFEPELSNVCTNTGCWQSMVPFPASLYVSFLLLCVFALVFRPGRELRLVFVVLASTQIFMGLVRLFVVPGHFYPEGTALQASLIQFVIGMVLLGASLLPYPKSEPGQ